MPRPISWLPRLHEISRSVAHSVRSHYDRRDLEQLFELQPRAAQKLIELLPSIRIGTARLVEREVLAGFLERVRDTEDTGELLDQVRAEKRRVSHRRNRSIVKTDLKPITIASLPSSISLSPGKMEINFQTVEELAQAMYAIARVLQDEGEAFAAAFQAEKMSFNRKAFSEADRMFEELATSKIL